MATLTLTPTREQQIAVLQAQLAPKGMPQDHKLVDRLLDLWTITEYVNWINGHDDPSVHGGLMNQASDWADYEITTARQVAEYLDECVERERRKDCYGWN